MDPGTLSQVLQDLPSIEDSRLLVGSANADDAGVFQINESTALVQTLDFFTPIVDDPYLFGQIAASNSLSDVYAMGGKPITAMAIAGFPTAELETEQIKAIFAGGADKIKEANCALVGGHTIKNPEPIYGLSVTGLVHPQRYLSNEQLRDGDTLILTKPLGTGIASSALKQQQASSELQKKSIDSMTKLNTAGAEIAENHLSKACTDITGFGLLGHLWEMCAASQISAELNTSAVPSLSPEIQQLIEANVVPGGSRQNLKNVQPHLKIANSVPAWLPLLLADAQTAGGLLIATTPNNKNKVLDILSRHDSLCAAEIGTCYTAEKTHIKLS